MGERIKKRNKVKKGQIRQNAPAQAIKDRKHVEDGWGDIDA